MVRCGPSFALPCLQSRIAEQQLAPDDWKIFAALIMNLAERAEVKIARMIAKILASENEATENFAEGGEVIDVGGQSSNKDNDGNDIIPSDDKTASTLVDEGSVNPESEKRPAKGHGRNGKKSFTNAVHVQHALPVGVIASICERCKKGRMSRYDEKIIIRIVGQPNFGAELHHCEQARCKICGRIARAAVPAEVTAGIGTSYINYHWSACAMLAVMHYFAAMPFKRLENLHKGWGVPMPDANQWNIVNEADTLLLPLFNAIEHYAIANGMSLLIDDTASKVISLQRQINAEIKGLQAEGKSIKEVRTGINATGVYIEIPEGTVTLYYTGLHHAGEIFDKMLAHRKKGGEKLAKVTDAASKNFDHGHGEEVVEGVCNAHAMLKFRDIKDKFPEEYAVAGAVYKQVFANDDIAKAQGLTPTERMLFHREKSLPLMVSLKVMCEEKITSGLVEPRSPLWHPLTFIINQWPRLTQFCKTPGIPLDTNLVEQSLIIPVRYLAASFNYQTAAGAEVGDRYMSLVITAIDNEIEPVAYLTYCLKNHEDLAKRPEFYLPWSYRDRMAEIEK